MNYLLKLNVILIVLMVFATFFRLYTHSNIWSVVGYVYCVSVLSLSCFCIFKEKFTLAVYFHLSIILSLILYDRFLEQQGISKDSIFSIFQLVSLLILTILLSGLIALKRIQIILHGHSCVILLLFNYGILFSNSTQVIQDKLFYGILALILVAISLWGSVRIFETFHFLIKRLEEEKEKEIKDLTQVIHEFIPICAHCKSVRNQNDEWISIEEFVKDRSNLLEFSHGVCPECLKKYYSEYLDDS